MEWTDSVSSSNQVAPLLMRKISTKKSIKVNEDTGIVCSICLGFVKPEDRVQIKCQHDYHAFCFTEYLKSQIKIKHLPLTCHCKSEIDVSILPMYVDQQDIDMMHKWTKELELDKDPLNKFCPFPNCTEHVKVNEQIKVKTMLVCAQGHEFCGNCNNQWHKKSCKNAMGVSLLLFKGVLEIS